MATRKLEVQIVGDDRSLQRALGRAGIAVDRFGKRSRALQLVGRAAGVAGAGVAAGMAAAVKGFASFDKQVSSLRSVSGATAKQMEQLRKQALGAGMTTAYSARQAAEAQTELAKGGLSVAKILNGGLKGALALAAAGEMSLADAATVTANALNLFQLNGSQASHVADAMATAANATTADVADFGMALSQGGAAAKAAGMSFDQTMVALEMLAKAGVKNSDAGTSLKTTLVQLAAPTKKAAGLAKDLGLKFFDNGGKIKSVAALSQMLRDRMGGLTKQQRLQGYATLAGTDGMRTLAAMYDGGAKSARKFEAGVAKAGTAAKVAADKQNNLEDKFRRLQRIAGTVGLLVGQQLAPTIEEALDGLSDFGSAAVDRFTDLQTHGKSAVGAIGSMLGDAFNSIDFSAIGQKISEGLSSGAGGGLNIADKMPAAITAGLQQAVAQVNGEQVLGKLVDILGGAFDALFKPSFWIEHLKAIFSIVTFVIPIGKLLKVPGFGFLFNYISKPFFSAIKAVGNGAARLLGRGFSAATTSALVEVEKVAPRFARAMLVLVTGGAKEVSKLPAKLGGYASRAVAAMLSAFDSGASRIGSGVGKLVAGAIRGIARITAPFRAVATSAVKAVVLVLRTWVGAHVAAGRALGSAVARGFRALTGAARSAASSVGRGAVAVLHALGARFVELGRNLVQGLANGVRDGGSKVANAIGQVASGAIKKAKGVLRIKSPSRVFHGIGEDTVRGFAIGLRSGGRSVLDAASAGMLFPLEAAITKLQEHRDALQKLWDSQDKSAQRADLVTALNRSRQKASSAKTKASEAARRAAQRATVSGGGIVAAGRMLQSMGLQVAENPSFGGVAPVHTKNSNHYKGLAVDVNAAGGGAAELGKLQTALARVREQFRGQILEAFIEDAGTANQHLHVAIRGSKGRASAVAAKIAKAAGRKVVTKTTKAQTVVNADNSVTDARKALREFDREARRASASAKIDLKIANVERLKAFRDALVSVRTELKDRLTSAIDTFRQSWEDTQGKTFDKATEGILKAFDKQTSASLTGFDRQTQALVEQTDVYKQLKAEQDAADAQAKADEDERNQQALQDALDADDDQAIAAARKEIEATARARRIADLEQSLATQTAQIEEQRAIEREALEEERATNRAALEEQRAAERQTRLDAETAAFQASLERQLGDLAKNLEQRKTSYAEFAKAVGAILAPLGLTFDGSADDESAIGAPDPPKPTAASSGPQKTSGGRPKKPKKKGKAAGGVVWDSSVFRVGEVGAEDVHLPKGARVTTASDSMRDRGNAGPLIGELHVHRGIDERQFARELAWQIATR